MSAAWTSGDESVTNAISGTSFEVLKGFPFKVLFAPEFSVYELVGPSVYVSDGIVEGVIIPKEQIPVAKALPVEYVDADGSDKLCVDYDAVSDKTLELTNGWYVVAGKVSRGSLTVKGNVHLILMDGCELTAIAEDEGSKAGIAVDSGDSLAIYGQKNGTGKLTAKGCLWAAGIGGQTPASWSGYGNCGSITINGGTVTAMGGESGAGIGGGYTGNGGTVIINGGRLKVEAGDCASAIGAGSRGASQGTVEISGGIFAWKPSDDWLVDEHLIISNNPDTSTCVEYPWIVVPTVCVTLGRELDNVTATLTYGDGSVTNAISGTSFVVPMGLPFKVLFAPKSSAFELVGPSIYESDGVGEDANLTAEQVPVAKVAPVEYVDADGLVRTCVDSDAVSDKTPELKSGWYVVADKVSRGSLAVKGDVHLILMDGCELTVAGGYKLAGIVVEPGNSLTIYGQSKCSGKLMATAGLFAPGIGGYLLGGDGNCGSVTINGGEVTAMGGTDGAGIGGAYLGNGGTVTINGGRLKVEAGADASAIGAGCDGASQGTVAISGGIFAWKPSDDWLVDGHSTFFNNSDASTCADYPWAIVPAVCVTLGRELENVTAAWTYGDGSVMNAIGGNPFFVPKGLPFRVLFAPKSGRYELIGPTVYESNGVWEDVEIAEEQIPVTLDTLVEYVDADGAVKACADCNDVSEATSELTNGWYHVFGKVSCGTIVVNGDVHLILMDDCELTLAGEFGASVVVGSGNSLTIYGQKKGSGKLTATGDSGFAGIGGSGRRNGNRDGGTVTINGGTVTATGGHRAAGIGGGDGGNGGTVTINGGTVTAIGGWAGAGIGGGKDGDGGTVTINGGTVTVAGGSVSDAVASIGGGDGGDGGTVIINGGRLKSDPVDDPPVIGAGRNGSSQGTVAISGGLFSWWPSDEWFADREIMYWGSNSDMETSDEYPCEACKFIVFVMFGRDVEHATAAWTSGDGSVTNAISGTSFVVPMGAFGVKVVFTPEDCYGLDKTEYVFAGAVRSNCEIPANDLPTATRLTVEVALGRALEHATAAWTSGDGTVTNAISGTSFVVPMGTPGVKAIFTPEDCYGLDKTEYVFAEAIRSNCEIPAKDLPTATRLTVEVALGRTLEHATAAWTSDDDSVMNAIIGTTFAVPMGAFGVKVIFTPEDCYGLDKTEYVFAGAIRSNCEIPVKDLPTATRLTVEVVLGRTLEHATAAWTSGDGTVTNAISGTSFVVPMGTPGVKVIFTPEDCYGLDKTEYVFAGAIRSNCEIPANDLPTATWLTVEVVLGRTLEHMTAAWTSDDDSVTNAISGTSFVVPMGAFGVKVIFTPEDCYGLDKTEYVFAGAVRSNCEIPVKDLPTATHLTVEVAFGRTLEHATAAWTSDDDSVTNAIGGTSFVVPMGTPGVKVIFTPEDCYGLDKTEYVFAEAINADFVIPVEDLPTAILTGPICEGGEIAEGEDGVWVVTPNAGVTEVTVAGLPEEATIAVPPTVTKVSGVADAQIKIKSGAYDITGAFTVAGGAIALNENGSVNGVPVKPTIGDLDEGEPFTLGDGSAAISVRTIPGLKYSLVRGTELGAITMTVVEPTLATEAQMMLEDTEPPTDKAFNRVVVSVP